MYEARTPERLRSDRTDREARLMTAVAELARRLAVVERRELSGRWRGQQADDFTLAELPNAGDYGYETTSGTLQVNVGGGVLRKISTSAV
jgi:hypothetical protein